MLIPVRLAIILTLASLSVTGCNKLEPGKPADEARVAAQKRALARKLQAACSSPATYDRLKQVAFEEAMRIRNADPKNLDTLATYSTVRMENPVVKSRDEALDVTVCSGRFVLDLPPGAERGFAGARQLKADVEYAAQMSADGSGLVYQIKGAEPIVYKLAAFDLQRATYRVPAAAADTQLSAGGAPTAMPPPQAREATPETPPSPRPVRTEPQFSPQPPVVRPSAEARPARQVAAASSPPSFNCRSARSRSERMVCARDRLASLDRTMSSMFYSVMSDADGATRAELRRSRDRFLAWRERCANESCIAQAYEDRMAEIRDIANDR